MITKPRHGMSTMMMQQPKQPPRWHRYGQSCDTMPTAGRWFSIRLQSERGVHPGYPTTTRVQRTGTRSTFVSSPPTKDNYSRNEIPFYSKYCKYHSIQTTTETSDEVGAILLSSSSAHYRSRFRYLKVSLCLSSSRFFILRSSRKKNRCVAFCRGSVWQITCENWFVCLPKNWIDRHHLIFLTHVKTKKKKGIPKLQHTSWSTQHYYSLSIILPLSSPSIIVFGG